MSRSLAGPLLLVGAGKMGGALLAGWLREGLDPKTVFIRDPEPSHDVAELIARHEIATAAAIEPDAKPSVVVLAVKPQIVDEVLPAALGELVDGFLALLDEGLQQLDRFGLVERALFLNFFQLDSGLHHTQDAESQLFLGTHGSNNVFLDLLGKSHVPLPFVNYSRGDWRLTEFLME